MFEPELTIAWMAGENSGRLAKLRRAVAWASGADEYAASAWISMLQPLGLADIDWESGTWSARPLAVTALPRRTNVALLTGSRPLRLLRHRQEGLVVRPYPSQSSQIPLPSTAWLQYSSHSHLEDTAGRLGAEVVPCAAETIVGSLNEVKLGDLIPGPSRTTPLKRFNPVNGCFDPCGHLPRPDDGLYEYKLYGRLPRYASMRDGRWHAADKRESIYLELPLGSFSLRWIPDQCSRHHRSTDLGRLTVDHRIGIPDRHQEAAVMCTGLPPLRANGNCGYDGVPFRIAERIAITLRRRLETA